MWLYDDKQKRIAEIKSGARSLKDKVSPRPPSSSSCTPHPPAHLLSLSQLMVANSYMMILVGSFIFVAGFYGCIVSIKADFDNGTVGSPFSCAGEFPFLFLSLSVSSAHANRYSVLLPSDNSG